MLNLKLDSCIGKGAFGTVWLAECDKKKYAVKIYKSQINKENIETALKLAQKIKHKNLMECYNFYTDILKKDGKERLIAVLEYIDGRRLSQLSLSELKTGLKNFLLQIISALKYLHINKIVHRDIKPENIMVLSDNTIKIIDYDFLRATDIGKIHSKVGTPYYVSYEIYAEIGYSEATDLWSLGVTLYYCLTGKFPYPAETEIELKRKILDKEFSPNLDIIPNEYKNIITGLLNRDPFKRLNLSQLTQMVNLI